MDGLQDGIGALLMRQGPVTEPARPRRVTMSPDALAEVLTSELGRKLLAAPTPAVLSYIGLDGFPRGVAITCWWKRGRIVMASLPTAAKVPAVTAFPTVALTVHTGSQYPPQELMVRGLATVELVDEVSEDYLAANRGFVPDDGFPEFEASAGLMFKPMALISVEPYWAKVLDFQTRIPQAMADRAQALMESQS